VLCLQSFIQVIVLIFFIYKHTYLTHSGQNEGKNAKLFIFGAIFEHKFFDVERQQLIDFVPLSWL
jgi:hypothetical protein